MIDWLAVLGVSEPQMKQELVKPRNRSAGANVESKEWLRGSHCCYCGNRKPRFESNSWIADCYQWLQETTVENNGKESHIDIATGATALQHIADALEYPWQLYTYRGYSLWSTICSKPDPRMLIILRYTIRTDLHFPPLMQSDLDSLQPRLLERYWHLGPLKGSSCRPGLNLGVWQRQWKPLEATKRGRLNLKYLKLKKGCL